MADGSKATVKLGATLDEAKADALEEAKAIAADMKDQDVKDAVAKGEIPEIVALIAYLNSLK
jgi:cytochrome c oxidase cbb3-type subunit 2